MAWNREADQIEYRRLLWIPHGACSHLFQGPVNQWFVVALTSRTASGGKRTGRWRNAVQHYCHTTDWGSQKNVMYFGPLAPRSQLVIITGKIEQPKQCWTAQILNISFYFHGEPFRKHPRWIGSSTCINLGLLTGRYQPNNGSIRRHKISSICFFLTEGF